MIISKLKLVNFTGIYDGMKLNEIELNFENNEENIFTFLSGRNGSGKSTILSQLHPYKQSFDGRTGITFGNALKEITIKEKNNVYLIQHSYGDVSRSYIYKNGELLNKSGAIKEGEALIESELSITQDYFNVGVLSSSMDSFIKLGAAERKKYISRMLPELEEYSKAFNNIKEKDKVLNQKLKSLKEQLKNDESSFSQTELDALISNKIKTEKELESIRSDKALLSQSLKVLKDENILVNIYEKNKEAEIIKSKIDSLISNGRLFISKYGQMNRDIVEETIKLTNNIINNLSVDIATKQSEISSLKKERDSAYYEQISAQSKLDKLNKIDVDALNKSIKELEAVISSIDTKNEFYVLASEDKISGTDLSSLRNFIAYTVNKNATLSNIFKDIDLIGTINLEAKKSEIVSNIALKKKEIDDLNRIINTDSLHYSQYLKTHTHEDNKECDDPNCPFMKEIKEYETLGETIELNKRKLRELEKDKEDIEDELDSITLKISSANEWLMFRNNLKSNLLFDRFVKKYDLYNISQLYSFFEVFKTDVEKAFSNLSIFKTSSSKLELNKKDLDLSKSINENYKTWNDIVDSKKISVATLSATISSKEIELGSSLNSKKEEEAKLNEFSLFLEAKNTIKELQENQKELDIIINKYNNNAVKIDEVESSLKTKNAAEINAVSMIRQLEGQILTKNIAKANIDRLNQDIKKNVEDREDVLLVKEALDPTKGIPLLFITVYLKSTAALANKLLKMAFGNEFEIAFESTANDFFIRVTTEDGRTKDDVSLCSDGQKALISLSISLALLEQRIGTYNIIALDEVDGVLDQKNRKAFINILNSQLTILGVEQCFIISHNRNFDDITGDLVMLKNSDTDSAFLSNKKIIWKYVSPEEYEPQN